MELNLWKWSILSLSFQLHLGFPKTTLTVQAIIRIILTALISDTNRRRADAFIRNGEFLHLAPFSKSRNLFSASLSACRSVTICTCKASLTVMYCTLHKLNPLPPPVCPNIRRRLTCWVLTKPWPDADWTFLRYRCIIVVMNLWGNFVREILPPFDEMQINRRRKDQCFSITPLRVLLWLYLCLAARSKTPDQLVYLSIRFPLVT